MGARDFAIVGVGASAGGLEALQTFFAHLPENTGMAFIVVTHTLRDRRSLLPELLAPHVRMPTVVVDDAVEVLPDHVYFSSLGKRLRVDDGFLHPVDDPQNERLPIDLLFRSLAADRKDRSIAVVLSGTGSDGTLGLKEIKGAGGMVMAQESARFPGMPESAIRTEVVDYVLPVEQLPEQLMAYVSGAGTVDHTLEADTPADVLKQLFSILRARTGHDFTEYKRTTLLRRIERRMVVHQQSSIREYLSLMRDQPAEVDLLFRQLLIGVTAFFRDPDAFALLESQVLPELLASRSDDHLLRVWVPGCSTGEEAYSLAIVLREVMDRERRHLPFQVFATDLDASAIDVARSGLYSASIAADLSPQRLERNFTREDDCFRIRKEVRERLMFAPQNLLEDPPFTKIDLLSCRNLLIYLEGPLQQRLIPMFHYALRPGGVLFLGSSESISGQAQLFQVIDKKWKLFKRKNTGTNEYFSELPAVPQPDARSRGTVSRAAKSEDNRIGKLVERLLLEELVPPLVLLNERGDVLHIHGRTGQFLEPAPGSQVQVNIYNMLRDNLQLDLTAALRRASADGSDVIREGVRVKSNGHWIRVRHDRAPCGRSPGAPRSLPALVRPPPRPEERGGRTRFIRSGGRASGSPRARAATDARVSPERHRGARNDERGAEVDERGASVDE